jgi:hypothetical protein
MTSVGVNAFLQSRIGSDRFKETFVGEFDGVGKCGIGKCER